MILKEGLADEKSNVTLLFYQKKYKEQRILRY
jgi:hypothetical protein